VFGEEPYLQVAGADDAAAIGTDIKGKASLLMFCLGIGLSRKAA
jgi:hypothetical protein